MTKSSRTTNQTLALSPEFMAEMVEAFEFFKDKQMAQAVAQKNDAAVVAIEALTLPAWITGAMSGPVYKLLGEKRAASYAPQKA